MARLAIYMNEAGQSVVHRAGFSWLAAVAVPVWALQHRLYKTAVLTFAMNLLAEATVVKWIELIPGQVLRTSVQLAYYPLLWVLFGFGASAFHRMTLERAGYFMTSAEPSRL